MGERAWGELETWLDMRQSRLNTLLDLIVQGRGSLSSTKRKWVLSSQTSKWSAWKKLSRATSQSIDDRA